MEKKIKNRSIWRALKSFSNSKVRVKGKSLSSMMLIGIAGVIFLYVSTAGIVSVVAPWWVGVGDSPRHIDYVWSIYNGEIPKFDDGLSYPALRELGGERYGVQPASANPPLFYIIHAPVVGPLLKSGHWHEAIAAGRAINIFIGVLCILALAWAGYLLGGSRKELFAVAVPSIAVLVHHFTSLNLNYAVDALLVLFTTLAFILMYKLIEFGPKRKYLIWLSVVSVLGMATKAPYIIILFVSFLGIIASYFFHGKGDNKKRIIKGILISTLLFAIVLLAIGWFYYFQNYKATGRWYSNFHFVEGRSHRPYKSLTDVLTGSGLWSLWYATYASIISVSVALTSFAVSGFLSIVDKTKLAGIRNNKNLLIVCGLLALATAGMFFTQIVEAVGAGNYYFRYLLPVILPISIFLCYGLLEYRWTRGMLVFIFSIALALSTIYTTPKSSAVRYTLPSIKKVAGPENRIEYATRHNNIPVSVDKALYASFAIGALALFVSLYSLSGENWVSKKSSLKS